jgi:hypothetical protein
LWCLWCFGFVGTLGVTVAGGVTGVVFRGYVLDVVGW